MSDAHSGAGAVTSVPLYDQFSADYDRFVNWSSRLAFERPFIESRLQSVGARRILDTACGTGQHSIALAKAGYQVVGSDLSAGMIEVARRNAAETGVTVDFVVAGFGEQACSVAGQFDAVLCLGNSLPHALTASALDGALADFRAVLRRGGLLIVQNRNFDQVWKTRSRWMPPETHREGDQEWLFLRFYDFGAQTITFNVVTLRRQGASWSQTADSTELRPIFQRDLDAALARAGFDGLHFYGSLSEEPFDPLKSGNLVAVARAT
jgi:SAM-dependent methyltransferase